MSKDPAFLFYPGDWLSGTQGMTFEQKGAYMELLMMQFNRGHMTSHMVGQVVGQIWDEIQNKFIQDENGLWYNVRLDEEKNKRKLFTASRKNNLKGNNQYTKKEEKKVGHMTSHMENENTLLLIKEKVNELYNSFSRLEMISRNNKISLDETKKYLSDFLKIETLKTDFTTKSLNDTLDHFVNWIAKKILLKPKVGLQSNI